MAEDFESLGLDASQYIAEVERIQKILGGLNSELKSVNFQLGNMEVAVDNQTMSIKKWIDANTQVSTSLKMVDTGWKVVSSSINTTTNAVEKQTYALKELEYAMQMVKMFKEDNKTHGVTGREGELELQIAMEKEAAFVKERAHRTAILNQQKELYNQLQAEATIRAQLSGPAGEKALAASMQKEEDFQKEQARRSIILAQQQTLYNQLREEGRLKAGLAANTQDLDKKMRSLTDTQEGYRRSVFLTAQQMGRLFVILTLRDAFYNFAGALRQSIQNTKEFEIQIGEIQTIAQRSSETFSEWAANITKLSDISGRDLKDVGEGVYQTLSNQVATGSDAIMFMTKALDFSRVSVASTADSVNLLSGVINSFGMNVYDTEKIAASLFKTIELGRVRASEMADTFGRIGVLASRLGVTLYETEAAVTTLTIQGVKFSDASTQIINIMSKLIRPSKALEEVFKSWGVNSGEAAIATFGFAGVLQKLEQQSHGSAEELATLFRDIRGIRGVLGLTGGAFDKFTESLSAVANQTDYMKAKQLAAANAGRDWEVQLNALKNYFTTDFGRPFLETVAGTVKHLGGMVPVIKEVVILIKSLAEAYIAYRGIKLIVNAAELANYQITQLTELGMTRLNATIAVAQTRWGLLKTAISGMITPMNLVTVAIVGVVYAYNRYQQELEDLARFHDEAETRITAAVQKTTDAIIKENQKQLEAITAGVDKRYKANYEFFNSVNLLETKASDKIKDLVDATNDYLKESFQNSFKDLELSISKINRLAEEAKSNALHARDLAITIQQQTNARDFEAGLLRLPPEQQLAAIRTKIIETQAAIRKGLGAPGNADPDAAKSNLRTAEKQIEEQNRLFGDAEKRRAAAVEKVKNLEQSILELREKQGGADVIDEDRTNLTEAQRAARASRKTKNPIDRSAVYEAQDELSRDRSAESDRQRAERLAKLQQELAVQQAIVDAALSDTEASRKKTEYAKQQVALLEQYAKLQTQISKQQSDEAERLRKQLETARVLFEELGSKFKADKVQTPEQKGKLLEKFDVQIDRGIDTGALDRGTLFELSKKRQALEAEADDNIRKHIIQSERDRATESERVIKQKLTEGSEQSTKISTKFTRDVQGLRDLQKELEDTTKEIFAYPENLTGKVRQAIQEFEKSQSPKSREALTEAFRTEADAAAKVRGGVIKPKTEYDPGRTRQDVIYDFLNTLNDAGQQITAQQSLGKRQQQIEGELKKVGIERQNIEKSASEALKDFGDQYIQHIKAASQTIQDVTKDFKALEIELKTFLNKPVSYAPVEGTGAPITGVASAVGVGGGTPLTINYYSQGAGSAQDAVSIGRAIQAEQRRGTL